MQRILWGQTALILCCLFYLIWWYRGFRPGVNVNRVGGLNGFLLLITAVLGIAGVLLSLSPVETKRDAYLHPFYSTIGGIVAYIILLIVTKYGFKRIVTTELFLIVGWTVLELCVINSLYGGEYLSAGSFFILCIVIAAAFVLSMILYVAYYRMEENKAFFLAMLPLVLAAVVMAVIILAVKIWH